MPETVITPAGYRLESDVHVIEPGTVLRGVPRTEPPESEQDRSELTAESISVGNRNWVTFAYWVNTTGKKISGMSTRWTVPPNPVSSSGQVIFIFNALVSLSGDSILQPVLQWGPAAGGGSYWAIATWYVNPQGVYHTPLVRVSPGMDVVGIVVLNGQTSAGLNYVCGFLDLAQTQHGIVGVGEFLVATEALEAYGVQSCSDYPATDKTSMRDISVKLEGVDVPGNWICVDRVADCGQHSVVVAGASGRSVDLCYV